MGLDLGPSTLAIVPKQGVARLETFCAELAPDAKARRRLARKLDRQRRDVIRKTAPQCRLPSGILAETGAHDKLMNQFGTYRRLYELQFANADAPKAVAGS